jgi:hypothetical protein
LKLNSAEAPRSRFTSRPFDRAPIWSTIASRADLFSYDTPRAT